MGSANADMTAYKMLGSNLRSNSILEDPTEDEGYAAASRQRRRRQSLESIKEITGVAGRRDSDFKRMTSRGKFHCGAEANYIGPRRDSAAQEEGVVRITKEQMMRALHEQKLGDAIVGAGMLKSNIDAPCLEGLWRNNQGGMSIRRKPMEHEAVFDFGDNRITMPKYLANEKAGQLVSCRPVLQAEGTRGYVVMKTKVPHRAGQEEAKFEAICDLDELDRHAKKLEEERPHTAMTAHAHLTKARPPPIAADMSAWRERQNEKRKALQEAETWQAIARKRQAARQAEGNLEDRDSEEEVEEAMPFRTTTSMDMVSQGSLEAFMQEASQPGERVRRGGMDLSAAVLEDLPWDARPPLPEPEVEKFFERIAFDDQTAGGTRRRASITGTMRSNAEERAWTLRSVGGALDFAVTFTTTVDASDFFGRTEAFEDEDAAADDEFWEDFFQPAAGTGRELGCFGACGC